MNEPTPNERGYAKLLYNVMLDAPSREHAVDLLARALAAHRERTEEVALEALRRSL